MKRSLDESVAFILDNENTFIGGVWSLLSTGKPLKFSKQKNEMRAVFLEGNYASNAYWEAVIVEL